MVGIFIALSVPESMHAFLCSHGPMHMMRIYQWPNAGIVPYVPYMETSQHEF